MRSKRNKKRSKKKGSKQRGGQQLRSILSDSLKFSVFAGSGTAGALDGPVATATFTSVNLMVCDSKNNIYIVQGSDLRKITGGVVSTILRSIGAPLDIAISSDDSTLYFAYSGIARSGSTTSTINSVNLNINPISLTSLISIVSTTYIGAPYPFGKITSIALHPNKRLYILTSINSALYYIDLTVTPTIIFYANIQTNPIFTAIVGFDAGLAMTITSNGNIYIYFCVANIIGSIGLIYVVDQTPSPTFRLLAGRLNNPTNTSIPIDGNGTNALIFQALPGTTLGVDKDRFLRANTMISGRLDQNIYFIDSNSLTGQGGKYIRRCTPTGDVTTVRIVTDDFNTPHIFLKCLAIDSNNNIYCSEIVKNQILILSRESKSIYLPVPITVTPSSPVGTNTAYTVTVATGSPTINFITFCGALGPDGALYVGGVTGQLFTIVNGIATLFSGIKTAPATLTANFIDGSIKTALFTSIRAITVGPDGAIYIADSGLVATNYPPGPDIIRVIRNGVVSTIAGGNGLLLSLFSSGTAPTTAATCQGLVNGIGLAAAFKVINGIAVGPDNTVYVADCDNNAIRAISPSGDVSTFTTFAANSYPGNICIGTDGNLYVPLISSFTIVKIPIKTGTQAAFVGSGTSGSANGKGTNASFTFTYSNNSERRPVAMAIDRYNNLYVGDGLNVRMITPSGNVTTLATVTVNIDALMIGPDGNLYVHSGSTTSTFNKVTIVNEAQPALLKDAIPTAQKVATGQSTGRYTFPSTVKGGRRKTRKNRRLKLQKGGNAFRQIPLYGVMGLSALSSGRTTFAIAVDSSYNAYVPSATGNIIYKFMPTSFTIYGNRTAGNISSSLAESTYNYPSGCSIDPFGNLYVTENTSGFTNIGVRRINMTTGTVNYVTPPTGKSYGNPVAICFDKLGNTFIINQSSAPIVIPVASGTSSAPSSFQYTPTNFATSNTTAYNYTGQANGVTMTEVTIKATTGIATLSIRGGAYDSLNDVLYISDAFAYTSGLIPTVPSIANPACIKMIRNGNGSMITGTNISCSVILVCPANNACDIIATDANGNLYVHDYTGCRILNFPYNSNAKYNVINLVITLSAPVLSMRGFGVSPDGNVIFAIDNGNTTVKVWTTLPNLTYKLTNMPITPKYLDAQQQTKTITTDQSASKPLGFYSAYTGNIKNPPPNRPGGWPAV